MQLADLISTALDLDHGFVQGALDGLSADELAKSPDPQSNNVGWLVWHKMRTEDAIVSRLGGKDQVFTAGSWHTKLGRGADAQITGRGEPVEQAVAFRVADPQALKDYCAAVRARTKEFLAGLSEADVNKEMPHPRGGQTTALFYLAILLVDGLQHSGQASYLRGHLRGFGWAPA